MNKKQYRTTLIAFGVIAVGFIATNAIYNYLNWLWIFIIVSAGYIYIRYKISAPLQTFSTRFNMLVDYDLDVEGALKLAKDNVENAPNETVKSLFMIYLGMALYYNSKYREAINTFNQINLAKVNHLYHVLIFAFTAYSAYEEGDLETFDLSINRMEEVKNRVQKKYLSFVASYLEILKAIKNLDVDPEHYREVIERNFSKEDGYLSTRLVYNYRMAYYYKTINNVEEMDKCLAKVIANGKSHHTAVQSEIMFKNTCNIEDYVFPDPTVKVENVEDVEIVEDPLQIESLDEVEVVEEKEENKE